VGGGGIIPGGAGWLAHVFPGAVLDSFSYLPFYSPTCRFCCQFSWLPLLLQPEIYGAQNSRKICVCLGKHVLYILQLPVYFLL